MVIRGDGSRCIYTMWYAVTGEHLQSANECCVDRVAHHKNMSVRPRRNMNMPQGNPDVFTIASPADACNNANETTPSENPANHMTIDPKNIKPIQWLNEAHYAQLKKKNLLDENFIREIESQRTKD